MQNKTWTIPIPGIETEHLTARATDTSGVVLGWKNSTVDVDTLVATIHSSLLYLLITLRNSKRKSTLVVVIFAG